MDLFSSVLTGSLQGIAERPLPCNYNVIQSVSAFHGGNPHPNLCEVFAAHRFSRRLLAG